MVSGLSVGLSVSVMIVSPAEMDMYCIGIQISRGKEQF